MGLCSRGALEAGAVVTLRETRYWIARSARGHVPLIAPPITSGRLPTLAEGTDRSVLDVLLEPGNVGALTFAAAWGFHHDRNARRTHDFR